MQSIVFSFHKRTPDFLEGCVGCFQRLGGVPEKFVVDNQLSIVEPRRPRTPARLHDEVAALFGHLKCLPVMLNPGKPESKSVGVRRNMSDRVRLNVLDADQVKFTI